MAENFKTLYWTLFLGHLLFTRMVERGNFLLQCIILRVLHLNGGNLDLLKFLPNGHLKSMFTVKTVNMKWRFHLRTMYSSLAEIMHAMLRKSNAKNSFAHMGRCPKRNFITVA